MADMLFISASHLDESRLTPFGGLKKHLAITSATLGVGYEACADDDSMSDS